MYILDFSLFLINSVEFSTTVLIMNFFTFENVPTFTNNVNAALSFAISVRDIDGKEYPRKGYKI